MRWDPQQYGRYSSERSRPFFDLLARVEAQAPASAPASVTDLGCGSGELTAALAQRWPEATIRGVDSSPDMIERANEHESEKLSFHLTRAEDFSATGVDVLISNALLQWVPDHLALLSRWADELPAGGWLAFQVPANFDSPSHRLMRELASPPRWRDTLDGVLRHADAVAEPAEYLTTLMDAGMRVDAWQTSYLHVLSGENPVLEWVRGTGLRPVLQALADAAKDDNDTDRAEFEAEYADLLRQAYPARGGVTVFPFLRTFVVASKP